MKSLAILAAALLAAPSAALAERIPSKARKLAEHGREMHQRGQYDRAITAFKEAYVIAPSPALLFNIAQAYRLQGNCEDAVLMYRRYLATGPDPGARNVAEQHLSTVERCVRKRTLNIPLGEQLAYLNVPPPPGPEKVILEDKPAPSTAHGGQLKKHVGMGLTLGGGVALATAAYFGYQSYAAERDVERAYERGAKWNEIKPIHARGERAASAAKIFGIGGGLAVAGGVALWVLGRRDERAHQLAVTPTRRGAAVGYSWQF